MAYDLNNQRIQKATEDATVRQNGESTLEDQVRSFIDAEVEAERESSGADRLSYERWNEIFTDCIRKYKAETARPGSARDEDGHFNDFLEVRRPFVSPTENAATN